MKPCDCRKPHLPRRVVLTGGPGAGKTAALELIRSSSANTSRHSRKPQASSSAGASEKRSTAVTSGGAACDLPYSARTRISGRCRQRRRGAVRPGHGGLRGILAGAGNLFSAVGTTRAAELARYDAVIHLRTPTSPQAYNHDNPLRLESIEEAAVIDAQIAAQWSAHPRVFVVEPTEDFLHKAARALALLRDEVPSAVGTMLAGSSGTTR